MAQNSLKKWYHKNKLTINAYTHYTGECLKNIIAMRSNPNVFDYARVILSFKENWDDTFRLDQPYFYFAHSPHWKIFDKSLFTPLIVELLTEHASLSTVAISRAGLLGMEGEIEGVKFGWVYEPGREAEEVFVEKKATNSQQVFQRLFWKKYQQQATLNKLIHAETDQIEVAQDITDQNYIDTPIVAQLAQELQLYLRAGHRRSVLFYGPPGTGKTNITRGLVSQLGLKTLRIVNLPDFQSNDVITAVNLLSPDAIILDDFDSMRIEDVSRILRILEKMNDKIKLVLGTANFAQDLPDNMIRPGRFDQAVEVSCLTSEIILQLVKQDTQLAALVAKWPVSYILELMKRVELKGKEYTLSNCQDLTDRITNLQSMNDEYKLKTN